MMVEDRPSPFPWPPVLLVGAIGLAFAADAWLPFRLHINRSLPGMLTGWLLLTLGPALALWAAVSFWLHHTSIRPDRPSEALIASGPFAVSRNPIYLGELVALAGAAITFDRPWLLLVTPLFAGALTMLAIKPEEAYLERRFGDAYRQYTSRVRRWL